MSENKKVKNASDRHVTLLFILKHFFDFSRGGITYASICLSSITVITLVNINPCLSFPSITWNMLQTQAIKHKPSNINALTSNTMLSSR